MSTLASVWSWMHVWSMQLCSGTVQYLYAMGSPCCYGYIQVWCNVNFISVWIIHVWYAIVVVNCNAYSVQPMLLWLYRDVVFNVTCTSVVCNSVCTNCNAYVSRRYCYGYLQVWCDVTCNSLWAHVCLYTAFGGWNAQWEVHGRQTMLRD